MRTVCGSAVCAASDGSPEPHVDLKQLDNSPVLVYATVKPQSRSSFCALQRMLELCSFLKM